MNDLVSAGHPYLAQYGYTALFIVLFTESFGMPLPGETFLIAANVLAMKGQLSIVAVVGWAISAVILGDNVGYLIGRREGHRWVTGHGSHVGITPARLETVRRFFDRFGPATVIVARFFPVLRQLNGIFAGSMQMPWSTFVAYNAFGGILWVGTWTTCVYFLGDGIERWLMQAHVAGWWLAGPLIATMVWLIYRNLR